MPNLIKLHINNLSYYNQFITY